MKRLETVAVDPHLPLPALLALLALPTLPALLALLALPALRSFEGRSSEGRSFEGRSSEGRSSEGRSSEGRSSEGRSSEGSEAKGLPSSEAKGLPSSEAKGVDRNPFRIRLVVALASTLALAACQESPPVETVLRPVRYETVSISQEARLRTYAGVARAGVESNLSFRVAGTVDRVGASVGQPVRRGQLLARLDPTDYELRVQEALAGLAQAEAASRNAEADYERVRGLYENNNASRRELDGARANSESSRAQVQAAEKRLEQARQQVSYCTLRAPVDGTVAAINVEVNENVTAGQKVVLLTSGSDTDVEVALPEAVIAAVEIGQRVEVRFDALPGRVFEAEVTEAGVAAVGTATTFPVTVRLSATDPDIRSGMAAEVAFRFAVASRKGRLLVSSVAVGEDGAGRFVFVLEQKTPPDDGGTSTALVRRREVSVGELTGDGLEILTGLEDGELVVTAGVRRLSDGERVRVLEIAS